MELLKREKDYPSIQVLQEMIEELQDEELRK